MQKLLLGNNFVQLKYLWKISKMENNIFVFSLKMYFKFCFLFLSVHSLRINTIVHEKFSFKTHLTIINIFIIFTLITIIDLIIFIIFIIYLNIILSINIIVL